MMRFNDMEDENKVKNSDGSSLDSLGDDLMLEMAESNRKTLIIILAIMLMYFCCIAFLIC